MNANRQWSQGCQCEAAPRVELADTMLYQPVQHPSSLSLRWFLGTGWYKIQTSLVSSALFPPARIHRFFFTTSLLIRSFFLSFHSFIPFSFHSFILSSFHSFVLSFFLSFVLSYYFSFPATHVCFSSRHSNIVPCLQWQLLLLLDTDHTLLIVSDFEKVIEKETLFVKAHSYIGHVASVPATLCYSIIIHVS